jgi:hypothetical protein
MDLQSNEHTYWLHTRQDTQQLSHYTGDSEYTISSHQCSQSQSASPPLFLKRPVERQYHGHSNDSRPLDSDAALSNTYCCDGPELFKSSLWRLPIDTFNHSNYFI